MVSQTDEVRKTGDIGGQPKITYWTPDGRVIRAMPDMHEYSRIKNGKVVENGLRDANLDKGWLAQKPAELKLSCSHCDLWHDTQKEITECGRRKRAFDTKWMKKSRQEIDEVSAMRKEIAELRELILKMGVTRSGEVLQYDAKKLT